MPTKVTYTALVFRSIQDLATYLFLVGRTRYCQLLETCVQLWVCPGKLTRSQPNPGESSTLSLGCWLGLSVGCSWYVSDINQGYLWVVQPPGSPVLHVISTKLVSVVSCENGANPHQTWEVLLVWCLCYSHRTRQFSRTERVKERILMQEHVYIYFFFPKWKETLRNDEELE